MKRRKKGAVLIFVLGMLMALSGLVSVFLSNVTSEVLLKFQTQGKGELKHYAQNAFNAVWCGLEDAFRKDELCSPLQGWDQIVSSINLGMPDSVTVEVKVQDESRKIPLNTANQAQLVALFSFFTERWDAQNLMREFLKWKQGKQVESKLLELDSMATTVKKPKDVQREPKNKSELPKDEAKKLFPKVLFPKELVSFQQLEELESFKRVFFANTQESNKKLEQLKACVSLWTDWPVNINSASKDLLEILSKMVSFDVDAVSNYLNVEKKVELKTNYYKDLNDFKKLGHGTLTPGMSLVSKENKDTQKSENEEAKSSKNTKAKPRENAKNLLCMQAQILHVDVAIQQADIVYHLFGLFKVEQGKEVSQKQLKTKGINNSKELMERKLTLLALSENPLQ